MELQAPLLLSRSAVELLGTSWQLQMEYLDILLW